MAKERRESVGTELSRGTESASLGTRIGNAWTDHPSTDLLVSILVGFHFWEVVRWGHGDILAWSSTDNRVAAYAAGAGVMSLIAGFAGAAIAQYGSSSGPIVSLLREKFGKEIRRNWMSITSWLLISALLCIVAMAIDGEATATRGSQWIFEIALAIATMKFARLMFLFNLILQSVDSDSRKKEKNVPAMREF